MSDSIILERLKEAERDRNDVARLRAENENLREENDAWRMDGASCADEVKRLREELKDAMEMLMNQARTIREYQLKEQANDQGTGQVEGSADGSDHDGEADEGK